MNVTIEHAQKINELLDHGLVQGMGKPVAGQMCVEAAVCFALGLAHSDKPPCVGAAVRQYKIRLNDAEWSSKKARAEGMRRVAIAQLGSDAIDQRAFADYVIIQGVRRILPIALRAAAKRNPDHAEAILATVSACEAAASIPDARLAASLSNGACRTAADADADIERHLNHWRAGSTPILHRHPVAYDAVSIDNASLQESAA